MVTDGQEVTYQGAARDGLHPGTRGRVLIADATSAHVAWSEGERADKVDPVRQEDLRASNATPTIEDHLSASLSFEDDSGVDLVMARQIGDVYPEPRELVASLADEGRLDYTDLTEAVTEFIGSQVLAQGGFRAAVAGLDDGDQADCIQAATAMVLRETLKTVEDGDV